MNPILQKLKKLRAPKQQLTDVLSREHVFRGHRVLLLGVPDSFLSAVQEILNSHEAISILTTKIYDIHYERGGELKEDLFKLLGDREFVEQCVEILQSDTDKHRVEALEQLTFKDESPIYGGKLYHHETLNHLLDAGLKFKVIYVIRDIRSIYPERKNPSVVQQFWARDVIWWEANKHRLEGLYLEVKFEDYVAEPERVIKRMADFLRLKEKDFLFAPKIKEPKYIDNWEGRLYYQTKQVLKIRGYV